jgi:hypothetical protein
MMQGLMVRHDDVEELKRALEAERVDQLKRTEEAARADQMRRSGDPLAPDPTPPPRTKARVQPRR